MSGSARRRRSLCGALVVIALLAIVVAVGARDASSEIEGDAFIGGGVRMRLPRGWRITEARSYPGVLLWMNRSRPPGTLMLTIDQLDAATRKSWPAECAGDDTARFVCALRGRLAKNKFLVSSLQGDRTPWFDYDDGKRWLRQGVYVAGDRAYTLVLGADTAADRGAHGRAFDSALRSLRSVRSELPAQVSGANDTGAITSVDAGVPVVDAGPPSSP
jgi:hypothetical protein